MITNKIIKPLFQAACTQRYPYVRINKAYFNSIFKKITQQGRQGADRRSNFKSRSSQMSSNTENVPFKGINKLKKSDEESSIKGNQKWLQYLSDDLKAFKAQHIQNVNLIKKANQYFLGRKMNTTYKKFYNQVSFGTIAKQNKIYRIDDIPFQFQNKKEKSMISAQSKRNKSKREQYLFEKISQEKLKNKMYQMAEGFFNDLNKRQRSVKIEPNFQFFAHSVIKSLKSAQYLFQIVQQPSQQGQKVQIKEITFLKGVVVNRNDNYTTDSYIVNTQKLEDQKIVQYILDKNQGQQYPQRQWQAMKSILVRFQAIINLPFYVDVIHPNRAIPDVGLAQHEFIFEMDLILPPKYSEFKLTAEQYSRSYRPSIKNLVITNVDRKNPFYALTYKEEQKQTMLINKLT